MTRRTPQYTYRFTHEGVDHTRTTDHVYTHAVVLYRNFVWSENSHVDRPRRIPCTPYPVDVTYCGSLERAHTMSRANKHYSKGVIVELTQRPTDTTDQEHPMSKQPRMVTTYTNASPLMDLPDTTQVAVLGTYRNCLLRQVSTPDKLVDKQRDLYGQGMMASVWSAMDWPQIQQQAWFTKAFKPAAVPATGVEPMKAVQEIDRDGISSDSETSNPFTTKDTTMDTTTTPTTTTCINCHAEVAKLTKGLCKPCYDYQRRHAGARPVVHTLVDDTPVDVPADVPADVTPVEPPPVDPPAEVTPEDVTPKTAKKGKGNAALTLVPKVTPPADVTPVEPPPVAPPVTVDPHAEALDAIWKLAAEGKPALLAKLQDGSLVWKVKKTATPGATGGAPKGKMRDDQVRALRAERKAGASYGNLATKYNISPMGARAIAIGDTYKSVV